MTLDRFAPALFVLIWSTGWIVAKYAAPHADPLTFLSLRFTFAALVFLAIIQVSSARWPSGKGQIAHAIFSGAFLHGIYLGGVWWAISQGVPASVSGLIAAMQPLMTAAVAPFIVGEQLTAGQKFGLVLGFTGIAIAVLPGLLALDVARLELAFLPLFINVLAMASVTAGTIYQKRYLGQGDLRREPAFGSGDGLVGAGPVARCNSAASVSDPSRAGEPGSLTQLSHSTGGRHRKLVAVRRTSDGAADCWHRDRCHRRVADQPQAAGLIAP